MNITFEMKELSKTLVINFENKHNEVEIMNFIDSFYKEWLNPEEYCEDEEMLDEIENMSAERWIIDHLDDYGYDVKDYSLV